MNKKLFKITVMTFMLGMTYIANAQNWGTSGNSANSNDVLGTTNNVNLNIITDGQSRIVVKGSDGNVGIGTDKTTGYKLSVEGKIRAREVVINLDTWADYVFQDSFVLMPIATLDSFIKAEKHLPGVPSQKEVIENGLSVSEMQVSMMQKIEELTLYIIQLQNQINELNVEKTEERSSYEDENKKSNNSIKLIVD